jgi:hypothetical protein
VTVPAGREQRQGTHWDGCWRAHLDCAVARAERAEQERDEELERRRDAEGHLARRLARVRLLEKALTEIAALPRYGGYSVEAAARIAREELAAGRLEETEA